VDQTQDEADDRADPAGVDHAPALGVHPPGVHLGKVPVSHDDADDAEDDAKERTTDAQHGANADGQDRPAPVRLRVPAPLVHVVTVAASAGPALVLILVVGPAPRPVVLVVRSAPWPVLELLTPAGGALPDLFLARGRRGGGRRGGRAAHLG